MGSLCFVLCYIRHSVLCLYSKDKPLLKQSGKIFVSTRRKIRIKTKFQLPEEITANANHRHIVNYSGMLKKGDYKMCLCGVELG